MARRTRMIAFASLAAMTALVMVVTPASAATYLRDFSVVQGSSLENSLTPKRLTLDCPSPKTEIGAAAFVSPTPGNLALQSASPFGTGIAFAASETDSQPPSWRLNARGFCALTTSAPLTAGASATHLKAIQIARQRSANNSSPAKTVMATCPRGKTAISGGGRIGPPNIDVGLTAMHRVGGGGWRVTAHEVDATTTAWTLYASVICANATTETATSNYANGYDSPSLLSAFSSMPLQSVSRSCTGTGFTTIGGGALLEGATAGSPPPADVVLTASEPLPAGWLAIAHEADPTPQNWRIGGVAICSALNGGPPA